MLPACCLFASPSRLRVVRGIVCSVRLFLVRERITSCLFVCRHCGIAVLMPNCLCFDIRKKVNMGGSLICLRSLKKFDAGFLLWKENFRPGFAVILRDEDGKC